MSLEDLNGWRQRAARMSDDEIKQMLDLENNAWVKESPVRAAQEPQHSGFAEAVGATGGYQFDPATLDKVIRKCQGLRSDLTDDGRSYDLLAQVRPIAPDEHASQPFSNGIQDFGQRQKRRNDGWIRYLDEFIVKLQETQKLYHRQEDQITGDLGNASQEQA